MSEAGPARRALVLGGSRGIGAAIAASLRGIGCDVLAASRRDVDTSDPASVRAFAAANPEADVLVLNTGGPPAAGLADVPDADWDRYHRQLFLGPCQILRDVRVRDGGYVFAVSSTAAEDPSPRLVVSAAYRAALGSVLRSQAAALAARRVSCVTIEPGPTNTGRLREVVDDVAALEARLPMRRLGEPSEIGDFVAAVVGRGIKSLSGVTVRFDGAAGPVY